MHVNGHVNGLADGGELRQREVGDGVDRPRTQRFQHFAAGGVGVAGIDGDLEDHVLRDVAVLLHLVEQPEQPFVNHQEAPEADINAGHDIGDDLLQLVGAAEAQAGEAPLWSDQLPPRVPGRAGARGHDDLHPGVGGHLGEVLQLRLIQEGGPHHHRDQAVDGYVPLLRLVNDGLQHFGALDAGDFHPVPSPVGETLLAGGKIVGVPAGYAHPLHCF